MSMKKIIIIILVLFTSLVIVQAISYTTSSIPEEPITEVVVVRQLPQPTVITLGFVGDIMMHGAQIKSGYDAESDTHSFNDYFQYLGNRFRNYDYLIGNLETPSDASQSFGAYPLFNAPPAILDALQTAGFDALQVANNHSFDAGISGMRTTLQAMQERDIVPLGISSAPDPYAPTMVDVEGIRLGFVAATYGFNIGGNTSDIPEVVHTIGSGKIEEMIRMARERGADIVIVMPHWGSEYQRSYSEEQSELAKLWIEAGADVIVGTHPHVVQPVQIIRTDTGRTGIIAYSLGNFVSNQQDRYTDLGGLLEITITDQPGTDTPPVITDYGFEYLYTHKHRLANRLTEYRTLLLSDAPYLVDLTEDQKSRITDYQMLPSVFEF